MISSSVHIPSRADASVWSSPPPPYLEGSYEGYWKFYNDFYADNPQPWPYNTHESDCYSSSPPPDPPPDTLDSIISIMRRMEARLDAYEQRLAMAQPLPWREPDPYGMRLYWPTSAWCHDPTPAHSIVPPSMAPPPQYQQHPPQQPSHLWMTQYQVPPPQQSPAAGYYYQQQQGQTAAAYGDTTLHLSEQPLLDWVPEVSNDAALASNTTTVLEDPAVVVSFCADTDIANNDSVQHSSIEHGSVEASTVEKLEQASAVSMGTFAAKGNDNRSARAKLVDTGAVRVVLPGQVARHLFDAMLERHGGLWENKLIAERLLKVGFDHDLFGGSSALDMSGKCGEDEVDCRKGIG